MAPVVPLVAAAAGAAVGPALGFAVGSIGASVSGLLVSTAVNAIGGRIFGSKPKAPSFSQEAQGRSLIIRSSIESHKIIYGQARVSGPLVHVATTNTGANAVTGPKTNKMLHMVIPLAGHEVHEIGDIYFNDTLVTLNASGFATSAPYSRSVTTTSTTASTATISSATRTAWVATYTTAAAHGFSAGDQVSIVGVTDNTFAGTFTIESVPTTTTFTVNSIAGNATLSAGGTATVNEVSTDTTTQSFVRVLKMTGAEDQAANTTLISEVPNWNSAHRLRGIPYIYVRMEFDPDIFPTGIPDVSAVVKGKKVYDPRSETTAWSDNAALCIRDYMVSSYGFGCDSTEINDTYTNAAANTCEESVIITGGTQDRYTCNGVVDTANAPLDNLQGLVTALAGSVTYVQGKFRIHAGAYDTPAGTITESDFAGESRAVVRTPRKELFNAVKGTYVDPDRNWQPTDFPPVTNSTYETQDGGEQIIKDIELPFTNTPEAAQRIGKLLLEKARQGIKWEVKLKHTGLKYAVYDVVQVDNEAFGWSSKVFRILKWAMKPPTEDSPGGITVVMQEESSASYDWSSSEESAIDAAPDTNLPDAFTVAPPGVPQITESKYITRNGDGVKAKATITWGESPDVFLRDYQAEYALASTLEWIKLPRTEATTIDIEDIEPNTYKFRVKAINRLGVSSSYSGPTTQNINGLLDPPTEPQNLTISTIGGLAILRWDEYAGQVNLDVKIGGKIVFRHSPDTTATWGQSTSIGEAVPGSSAMAILPLKPGKYFAKAVDSVGTFSTSAATVTTEQATALEYGPVEELTEHTAFSGDKTNCYITDAGALSLSGAGLFDDIPDFDEVESLDAYGGVAPSGTYSFSGGMDFTTKSRVRLTSHVKAQTVNVIDLIDNRVSPIDTWESFDGDTGTSHADAKVYIRTTDDDPSGTPTWESWQRIDSGEIYARAVEAQARLSTNDPAYNIRVSELKLTAEEVV